MNIFKLFRREPTLMPPLMPPAGPPLRFPAQRFESVRFRLELDKKRVGKHLSDICLLTKQAAAVIHGGETLNVTYTLNVQYFDDVVGQLQTLRRLLQDRKVIRHVDVDELLHGESLIVSVLDEINALKMYTGT